MAPPQQAAQEIGLFVGFAAQPWNEVIIIGWRRTARGPGDERKLSSLAPPAFFCEWVLFMRLQDSLSCLFLHQYKESKAVFILGSVGFSGQWSSQHRERHKNIEMLFHLRTSFFLHTLPARKLRKARKSSVERGPVNEISSTLPPPNHRKIPPGDGAKSFLRTANWL